jgi:nucleotide-binding universal stress UspA family protein
MAGILVGIDGSEPAQRALDWAIKHAAIEHAPLTVLAVHQVVASMWTGTAVTDARDVSQQEKTLAAAQAVVDKALAASGDARPASVTVRAVSGHPAEVLINASADADLVVVGARGVGGFARLRTGSAASEVVNHAASPVVVVR